MGICGGVDRTHHGEDFGFRLEARNYPQAEKSGMIRSRPLASDIIQGQ